MVAYFASTMGGVCIRMLLTIKGITVPTTNQKQVQQHCATAQDVHDSVQMMSDGERRMNGLLRVFYLPSSSALLIVKGPL